MDDEAKILNLLSEAAQSEAARLLIEEQKLSAIYELLSVMTERRDVDRRTSQTADMHLDILQSVMVEMVGLYRETNERIGLLLMLFDDPDGQRRDHLKTLVNLPGSKVEQLTRMIGLHELMLGKLREQAAMFGELHTPPHITINIESLEIKITRLQKSLSEATGGP